MVLIILALKEIRFVRVVKNPSLTISPNEERMAEEVSSQNQSRTWNCKNHQVQRGTVRTIRFTRVTIIIRATYWVIIITD